MIINYTKQTRKSTIFLTAFTILAGQAFAAERENLRNYNVQGPVDVAPATLHERLRLNPSDLEALRSFTYPSGRVVTRHQQLYHGVPVWGEGVVEHVDPGVGGPSMLIGTAIRKLDVDLHNPRPNLSADEALSKAKATAQIFLSTNEQIKLWVKLDERQVAHLIYHVSFNAINTAISSRPQFIIDANTGAVLEQWEGINNFVEATGTGGNLKTSLYEFGNGGKYMPLIVDQISSTVCAMNSGNVVTTDLKKSYLTSNSLPYQFQCFRNAPASLVNGGYAAENDAHYFGNATFKMYSDWFGLRPIRQTLLLGVHAGNLTQGAEWNGIGVNMIDGYTNYTYPYTTADIIGHEVSHGFTEQNSGLLGGNTMSGAINEAFSDMAGEALKFYLNNSNNFLFGADIMWANRADHIYAVRDLSNPKNSNLTPGALDNASQWVIGTEPHLAATIFGKAFYNLAITPGWNTRMAFEVMVDANRLYWSSNTDFKSAVCGVLQAAKNRSYPYGQVAIAFGSVGVTCQNECPVSVSLGNAPDNLGATSVSVPALGSVTFKFDATYIPGRATAYWYGTKNGVQDANGQAITTVPGTYTYVNSPGAEGTYVRYGVIKDSTGGNSCRTNDVTVTFLPSIPSCYLSASSSNVQKGASYSFTLLGNNLPSDAQGYWYGTKNGVTDVSGSLAGPVPATFAYTDQLGWNGNYTRYMQVRSGGSVTCTTDPISLTLQ